MKEHEEPRGKNEDVFAPIPMQREEGAGATGGEKNPILINNAERGEEKEKVASF